MKRLEALVLSALIGAIALCSSSTLLAQRSVRPDTYQPRAWSSNVIVPQTYRSRVAHNAIIRVTDVAADVAINEQAATTTLNVSLHNNSSRQETAELLIPVPHGAVIRSFTFQGEAEQRKVEILAKDKAKATFDSIVAKLKDPALVEFAGYNLIRTSVFPVEGQGEQKLQVVYEHLLKAEGERVDYVLPRSGSVVYDTPWKVNVSIQSKRPVTAVYSPSHPIKTSPVNRTSVTTELAESGARNPGPFKVSYLLEKGEMTASMFAYPDANGEGGYFLLLAGLGAVEDVEEDEEEIKREITLVIDRSGSMQGDKIEQAKEAALQVIAGMEYGESFNIITYSDEVETFAKKAVEKTKASEKEAREFIEAIIARGGTNLHDALVASLRPAPTAEQLPIVMFMTDGLATVGVTAEADIRAVAQEKNPHERRIFSFGVGYDVNTPLLDKIATSTRAFSTFVSPEEDVEAKVARVFRGLDGPTLAKPSLDVLNAKGKVAPRRISELLPGTISDLYDGDQLVLLGRYRGKKPLHFRLTGMRGSKEKSFNFKFDVPKKAKVENTFVARLWASRKIGQLTDSVRDLGASGDVAATDGRLTELTDEIVRLSKEFGILTEYTSFLAREGVDLGDEKMVTAMANEVFADRAVGCRTGIASANQERNNMMQRGQSWTNNDNSYWSADMKRASIATVQQCNEGAYYRRGGRWVSDANVDNEKELDVDETVELGSERYNELVWKLLEESRNAELALDGDILITIDGKNVLIKATPEEEVQAESEDTVVEQSTDKPSDQKAKGRGRW